MNVFSSFSGVGSGRAKAAGQPLEQLRATVMPGSLRTLANGYGEFLADEVKRHDFRVRLNTAEEVVRVGEATAATRENAMAVKTVADDLGAVAARIRGQVDQFFAKLHAA